MYNGYRIISLCMGRVYDERNVDFIGALNSSLCERGFRLLIYQTCSDMYWRSLTEKGERLVFDAVDYEITDVIMLFDETFHDDDSLQKLYEAAKEHDVPVLCIGGQREGVYSFPFDYGGGFAQVLEHVIVDHQITDVHMIAGFKDEPMSEERIRIYKESLKKHGIVYEDTMLSYGDYWEYPTRDAVNKLVAQKRVPKALICANDMMAITACETLKQHGYAVPEDVIVTGFDGVLSAYLANPTVTTCKCDFSWMAEDIAGTLKELFAGREPKLLHPVKYVIEKMESCGCGERKSEVNVGLELKQMRDLMQKYQDDDRFFAERGYQVPFCEDRQAFYEILKQCGFYYTTVLINRECFDESVSPMQKVRQRPFDDEMYVAYIAGIQQEQWPERGSLRDIFSEKFDIFGRLSPLVFTALNYLDIPLGVACFYFHPSMHDYCKISQYTTSITNAISTYRNTKYQQYMTRIVEESYKLDYLTGLYNRDGFYKEYGELCKKASDMKEPRLLVVSVDLDGLKYINDNFGHEEGDFAIQSVARALACVQIEDKVCARFGGDEMVLCTLQENVEGLEEQIRRDMQKYIQEVNDTAKKPYPISFSMGVSAGDYGEGIFESMLRISDGYMYEEKKIKPGRRR